MKISKALRDAWKAYTASFSGTLCFLVVEACLTLICLAPCLLLTQPRLVWGAVLSPVLFIFLLLPARMNAAKTMREALRGGSLGSRALVETEGYGAKLACGLKRAGFLLLWGAPLIALLCVCWTHYAGDMDSFTVLRLIKNELGGGDQMRGILVLVLMLLAALLTLTLGCAFHSGARHAFARGDLSVVRGHHGRILLSWLASLLAILPLVIALIIVICRYAPALSDLNGLLMGLVKLPSTRETILILVIGAALTLPLLPLRSLIPAAFVNGLKGRK
ncbi:MAG: hypothetical protein IJ231_07590 [Clostridia bacterium]|nr:hypothetical protein [Clostridia bacterium]